MLRSLVRNTKLHLKIIRNINSNSFYKKEMSVLNYCTSDSNKESSERFISNTGKIKINDITERINDLQKLINEATKVIKDYEIKLDNELMKVTKDYEIKLDNELMKIVKDNEIKLNNELMTEQKKS